MIFYSYQITWKKVQDISDSANKDYSVVTYDGYQLCSRDRKLDGQRSHEMYKVSLVLALQKGKTIPADVLVENREIVEKTMGPAFISGIKVAPQSSKKNEISRQEKKTLDDAELSESDATEEVLPQVANDFEVF